MRGGRVYYPGRRGAYSERAAHAFASILGEVGTKPAVDCGGATFLEAWNSCLATPSSRVVLPLKNVSAGWVVPTAELMSDHRAGRLVLAGTTTLAIQHALLGVPTSNVSIIKEVWSHPQALAQCAQAIANQGWTPRERPNTAVAAAEVAAHNDPEVAAIASAAIAAELGLTVLQEGLQDRPDNATTFGLFAQRRADENAFEKSGVPTRLWRTERVRDAAFTATLRAFDAEDVCPLAGVTLVVGPPALGNALGGEPLGDYAAFDSARARAFS